MKAVVEVFVGMGSNIQPAGNIRAGLKTLQRRFGPLRVSPVYRNPPVGFDGDDFYNLVVAFDSVLDIETIDKALEEIEETCGRDRDTPRYAPRTLDLDLLLYGDAVTQPPAPVVPRAEILRYAFVLKPLADLAGRRRHPTVGRSFATLWEEFSGGGELVPVVLGEE